MNIDKLRLLSIDVGLKRVGVAIFLNNISVPLNAVIRKNRIQASNEISKIIKNNNISTLIAGLPLNHSSEEQMSRRIKHFISLLRFDGDIFYQDESGSTNEAKEMLKSFIKQKRDGRIDSLCAKIIMDRWLFSIKSN